MNGATGARKDEGHAHVAGDEMADPVPVLDQQRPVDAQLVIEDGHRAGIGQRTQDRAPHIARQQLAAEEHHDRQDAEGDQRQQHPLQQKFENRGRGGHDARPIT